MSGYLTKRFIHSIIIIFGISIAVFVISRLTGDPVSLMVDFDTPMEDREVMRKELGLDKDADVTLARWIKGAKRYDPEMKKYDLAYGKKVPHSVRMAKPMWIFEQLRKEKPDIVARYFQAKRKLAKPGKIKKYTADDSVAVLSIAMGRDLFPWFKSLGITVDPQKAQIKMAK